MENSDKNQMKEIEMEDGSTTDDELSQNEITALVHGEPVILYKRRWFMLFIFALNNFIVGLFCVSLSGINDTASKYYNVSSVAIEWLTNMSVILYIFCIFPTSYLISVWGVRPLLIASACLQSATAILQYVGRGRGGYWIVAFGQILSGIGSCVTLQSPGKVSALWFPENERASATSIGTVSNIFGMATGFIHSTWMIKWSSAISIVEIEMKMFYISRVIMAVTVLVLTTLVYQENPPSPPSSGSARESPSLSESIKVLRTHKYFICLSQSFAISIGTSSSVMFLLNPFITSVHPIGYDSIIGWMGFSCSMASIFGFVIVGRLMDTYHKYRLAAILLNAISMIIWLVFFVVLTNIDKVSVLFVIYVILGGCFIPFQGVGIEQAAEMTYPISEHISSGILMLLANIYLSIIIYALGVAIQNGYVKLAGYVVAGLYGLSSVLACFVKTELKRFYAEG